MELWVEMQKNEKIKLLYGTGNPAKLDVMRRRMRDLNIEILGLKDFKEKAPDVPEDGNSSRASM